MRVFAALAAVLVSICAPQLAHAATYYVSPSGSDLNAGTATNSAWASAAKVNASTFAPGDRVLFEGGKVFSGALAPPSSGSAGSPITFGSYGSGQANLRNGITLSSKSWVTLENLAVDTGDWRTSGQTRGITSQSGGTGSKNFVVQNCSFRNVALGIMLANHGDQFWTVRNTVIQYTRDSGILIFDPATTNGIGGDSLLFEGNSILDVGLDTSVAYYKHGVYSKGTNVSFRANVVRRWGADAAYPGAAFSIRAHNTTVEGNVISGGPYGVNWTGYDSVAGTSTIAYNRMSNISLTGIETTRTTGPVPTVESFVIADNSISTTGTLGLGKGIRTQGTAGSITIANNLVTGTHHYVLWIDGLPAGGLVERGNLWNSSGATDRWNFNGTEYTSLSTFQRGSGHGSGDLATDPQVDANLVPSATSPVIDAGTMSMPALLAYTGDCTNQPYHYCGLAPDLGAVETGSVVAPPTAPPAQPSVMITSPKDNALVPLSFTVAADASSSIGVSEVSFRMDGTLLCRDQAAPYRCSIRAKSGWHTITATAKDSAGGTSSASIRVKAVRHVSVGLASLLRHAVPRVPRRTGVFAHRHAKPRIAIRRTTHHR